MISKFTRCQALAITIAALASAMFAPCAAMAATIPYSENFDSGSAPDFTLTTVDSAYATAASAWSFPTQNIRNTVASGTIRSKATVPLTNAYAMLSSGVDILTTADVNLAATGNGVNTGIFAFEDLPVAG